MIDHHPLRTRLQPILLICGGLLAAVLLAELGLRLSSPSLSIAVQWGQPDDAVERRANITLPDPFGPCTFDANGFRQGSELPYDRSILFVGDSFTEGLGTTDDATFARATERALRRDGLMVRSLNAGQRGFGQAQELKVLRRMVSRVRVDALVVQAFPMNDISDNLAYGGFGIEDGRLIEYAMPRPPLRARVTEALSQSWLYDLYVVRLAANVFAAYDGPAPFDSPSGVALEHLLLGEIVATARHLDIPIVVLVVPTKAVQLTSRTNLPRDTMAEIQRYETVRAMMNELGVAWVDAGEVIPNLEADAAKCDGGHFSKDGNAQIGEAIARVLKPLLTGAAR